MTDDTPGASLSYTCPSCRSATDIVVPVSGQADQMPTDGAMMFCVECATFSVYCGDDKPGRKITLDEANDLMTDLHSMQLLTKFLQRKAVAGAIGSIIGDLLGAVRAKAEEEAPDVAATNAMVDKLRAMKAKRDA